MWYNIYDLRFVYAHMKSEYSAKQQVYGVWILWRQENT